MSDDTSLAFALLYLQELGELHERTIVAQYFLPLDWYARSLAHLDPVLAREAASRAGARRGLSGRALGDRLAADARELAIGLASRAVATRDVFVYRHEFATEERSMGDLPLVDRGLVYQVVHTPAESDVLPDTEFARFAAYLPANRRTFEEGVVARRYAVAANRGGIARVRRGDAAGAESEFRRALALDPRYPQAWLNLGLLAADYLERPDEARSAWRTYLDLAGDEKEAASVRARLAALLRAAGAGAAAVRADSAPEPEREPEKSR